MLNNEKRKKIEALPVTIESLFKRNNLNISTYMYKGPTFPKVCSSYCHFLDIVETSIYVLGQEMVGRSAQ